MIIRKSSFSDGFKFLYKVGNRYAFWDRLGVWDASKPVTFMAKKNGQVLQKFTINNTTPSRYGFDPGEDAEVYVKNGDNLRWFELYFAWRDTYKILNLKAIPNLEGFVIYGNSQIQFVGDLNYKHMRRIIASEVLEHRIPTLDFSQRNDWELVLVNLTRFNTLKGNVFDSRLTLKKLDLWGDEIYPVDVVGKIDFRMPVIEELGISKYLSTETVWNMDLLGNSLNSCSSLYGYFYDLVWTQPKPNLNYIRFETFRDQQSDTTVVLRDMAPNIWNYVYRRGVRTTKFVTDYSGAQHLSRLENYGTGLNGIGDLTASRNSLGSYYTIQDMYKHIPVISQPRTTTHKIYVAFSFPEDKSEVDLRNFGPMKYLNMDIGYLPDNTNIKIDLRTGYEEDIDYVFISNYSSKSYTLCIVVNNPLAFDPKPDTWHLGNNITLNFTDNPNNC